MIKGFEYNNLACNLFGDIITYKQTELHTHGSIFFQN